MPVISLDIIGVRNGITFYPTATEVATLQDKITSAELGVLSSNFPNQLGFVSHVDPKTGLNQYDIAKQAVHDAFPGYIVVAADQSAYPTTAYTANLNNGITVLADIRIVELALNETIQDAMLRSLTTTIQSSLSTNYPDLKINVASTMITGNVDISLPGVLNVTGGAVDGVISAMERTWAHGTMNARGRKFLGDCSIAARGARSLDLCLLN